MTFQLISSPQGHQVSNWPPPPPNLQGVFPHPSPCGHLQHIPPSYLHHHFKVVPPFWSCRLPHPMGMAPIPTAILPMSFVPIHIRKSMDWVKYKEGGDPNLMWSYLKKNIGLMESKLKNLGWGYFLAPCKRMFLISTP